MMKVTDKMNREEIKAVMKKKGIKGIDLAANFEVTLSAVTQALNKVPIVKSLRAKIINYINNYK